MKANPLKKNNVLAIQWNMNGFFNNLGNLEVLVQKHQPIVLAIQETHKISIKQLNNSLGKKYNWTHYNEPGHSYRSTAIGIHKDYNSEEIEINSDLLMVGMRLKTPFPISVISGYLPNDTPNVENRITKALQDVDQPMLVMMDANGHHPSWGCKTTNPRGIAIANYAINSGLSFLNDGSNTRISGTSESAIDISMEPHKEGRTGNNNNQAKKMHQLNKPYSEKKIRQEEKCRKNSKK